MEVTVHDDELKPIPVACVPIFLPRHLENQVRCRLTRNVPLFQIFIWNGRPGQDRIDVETDIDVAALVEEPAISDGTHHDTDARLKLQVRCHMPDMVVRDFRNE